MDQVTRQEQSAGGVVYRPSAQSFEFLIGQHSGYHKWILPKGMVEPGETLLQTAEREVFEEVGVQVKTITPEPFKTISYDYLADIKEVVEKNPHTAPTTRRVMRYQEDGGGSVHVFKSVSYYLMEFVSDSGSHGWEMTERKWVRYEVGMDLLAFETERGVLSQAYKLLGASDQS